jgi:ClpP class serine protease
MSQPISARNVVTGLFNKPVALLPGAASLAIDLLSRTVGGMEANAFGLDIDGEDKADRFRPYDVVNGVALIPISGVLVQRLGWLWYYGDLLGISGYDRIRMQFLMALDDEEVDAIAFLVDSPGGDVAALFDLVDTIFNARGTKPIAAILGENAYSAGYALASAADPGRVWVPRTGGTGSVGVIYIHLSIQEWLAKTGIKPTLVTKGDLKGEGSELFDLSEDAFKRLRADVETVGDLFDKTVARNRGMSEKDVFDTQAGTFLGGKGVDIGFADAVAAPDEAFRALLKQLD